VGIVGTGALDGCTAPWSGAVRPSDIENFRSGFRRTVPVGNDDGMGDGCC
jgi:hypothetical protein